MIDVMLLNVLDITQEDLHAHTSPTTEEKLCSNPLQRTFELLGEILIQRSREDMERQTERVKMVREAKAARAKQLLATRKRTLQWMRRRILLNLACLAHCLVPLKNATFPVHLSDHAP